MEFLKKYQQYLVVIMIIAIVYLILRNINKRPGITTVLAGIIPPKFKYEPEKVDRTKSIGFGSKNSQEVAYLQVWLNTYYQTGLNIDGDFGKKTLNAVKAARPGAPVPVTFTLEQMLI